MADTEWGWKKRSDDAIDEYEEDPDGDEVVRA